MSDDLALSPETTAKDVPGWDSFKMVEIIVTVEERFGVQITSRDVDRLRNLGDLVTMISGQAGPGRVASPAIGCGRDRHFGAGTVSATQ